MQIEKTQVKPADVGPRRDTARHEILSILAEAGIGAASGIEALLDRLAREGGAP